MIEAIDRTIALKATHNIRVLNLSLGRPIQESFVSDPLCVAVKAAWDAGIVVVVAAGKRWPRQQPRQLGLRYDNVSGKQSLRDYRGCVERAWHRTAR